ncbi:MAG: hypothetical protein V1647_00615 [Pseudomonadota bacterium]
MIESKIIFNAAYLFIAVFAVHVVYWRTMKPKKQMSPLFYIFILVPIMVLSLLGYNGILNNSDTILISVLYIALALAYIQTYPAIQANSPSLYLVNLIGKTKQGLSVAEIERGLGKKQLIDVKVSELEDEKLITVSDNSMMELKPKGKVLALVFICYRAFLGISEGRG